MRTLGPISVVVVNWNGAAYLDECLRAVSGLRGGVDEVLVVDNASTDGSLALLAEKHPDVRVLRLDRNDGPARARNAGMRAAKNRWILALDNDALVRPDTLEKLVAAAAADPAVAIAQPRSLFESDPARVHYDGGSFHYAGLIALRNFYVPLERAEGHGNVSVDCAVAVALLVDRDALRAAGDYDESFFILFEDLDLSYRLRAQGYRLVSVEDAIVLHRGGTGGLSFREGPRYPASRVFFHSRNRWLFIVKDYRARTILAALPGLCLYEAAWLGFAIASGGFGAWIRGKSGFVRLLPHVLRERRAFQERRSAGDRSLLVGGPLTPTPTLGRSGLRRTSMRVLDRLLHAWWRIGAVLAG